MHSRRFRVAAILWPLLAMVVSPILPRPQGTDEDREAIIEHLHSIFAAYKRQDSATIRATHTRDWTGFLGGSQRILRGIDDYMDGAERSMRKARLLDYEITDIDVQLYGEIALVFYTAEIRVEDLASGAIRTVPLRSVDIYRKDPGGWNQAGSHIGVVPEPDPASPWASDAGK